VLKEVCGQLFSILVAFIITWNADPYPTFDILLNTSKSYLLLSTSFISLLHPSITNSGRAESIVFFRWINTIVKAAIAENVAAIAEAIDAISLAIIISHSSLTTQLFCRSEAQRNGGQNEHIVISQHRAHD